MNNAKVDIGQMSREELLELQEEIGSRLKQFKQMRIKSRFVTCGVAGCWCEGRAEHGPYLYVSYRQGGKQKTASLGHKFTVSALLGWQVEFPVIWDFLTTPDEEYGKMARIDTEGWVSMELSDSQFMSRYGVSKEEDKFNRHVEFWGPMEEYDRYCVEHGLANERAHVPFSDWARYGVGTLKGIATLDGLRRQGYYIK